MTDTPAQASKNATASVVQPLSTSTTSACTLRDPRIASTQSRSDGSGPYAKTIAVTRGSVGLSGRGSDISLGDRAEAGSRLIRVPFGVGRLPLRASVFGPRADLIRNYVGCSQRVAPCWLQR